MPYYNSIIPERADYDLELVAPSAPGEPYLVQAKLTASSAYRLSGSDAQFNISSVLGNDNGSFVWGRTGFEKGGRDFKLIKQGFTDAFLLTGTLKDLDGNDKDASINLDDKLEVVEYVNQTTWETSHKLAVRKPSPPQRNLILCFDGTSNHFSEKNTNVVKFVELLKKNDPEKQMVYYQTGVGTYSSPGITTDVGLKFAEKADEGVAWYLYQHVIDGYKYLMQTYRKGDRISIFGFSRGAFTARALAGMIHCVGLLPRHNAEHIAFAYEVYKNAPDYHEKPPPPPMSGGFRNINDPEVPAPHVPVNPTTGSSPKNVNPDDFKRTFCIPVTIDFVGVWDTVASVGALYPQTLPWIGYNPSISTFRQALALDERRGNFIPSVWDHRYTDRNQSVLEVWFRGEHSDIGGGSHTPHPPDSEKREEEHGVMSTLNWAASKIGFGSKPAPPLKPEELSHTMLANIPLRWMVRQCIDCNTRIIFEYAAMEAYRKKGVLERPVTDHPKGDYMARMEASTALDKADINRAVFNSIGSSLLWNGLETLPVSKPTNKLTIEPDTNQVLKLEYTRWPNWKKGRSIHCRNFDPVLIHSSVIDYMISTEGKVEEYVPRATWHGMGSWLKVADPSREDSSIPEEVMKKLGMPEEPVPAKTDAKPRKWYFF